MRRFPSAVADGLARRRKRSRTKRARSTPRFRGVVWSCSRTVFSILLVCWGIRYFEVVSSSLSPFPRTPFSLCYLLPALTRSGNSKFMVDSLQLHESIVLRIPCDPQPASDTNANAGVGEAEVLEPEAKGRRRERELAHFTAGERGDRAVGRIPHVIHLPKAGERTLRRGVEGGVAPNARTSASHKVE